MLRHIFSPGVNGLLTAMLVVFLAWAGSFWAGCKMQDRDARVTLEFSAWGSAEEVALYRELMQQFETKHPDIHIEFQHIPENYFQKLHILVAGGLTPDVMAVNSLSYPVYAANGILAPLDKHLDSQGGTLGKQVFFPASLKAFSWEGKLYAIPRDISNLVVFYNKTLFRKAGVPFPDRHWTWQDLLTTAQKLTQDTDGDGLRDQFGLSFFGKPPLLWLPFVWSNGGDILSADMKTLTLHNPKTIEALQFYADLRNRWHVAPTQQEAGSATMSQLFMQQKLAMLISGRWTVPVLREQGQFAWDVAPFPSGKAGSVVGIDATGYAISAKTKYPEESWAWVAFLSSSEAQALMTKSGLIVPARQDVAKSAEFLKAPPANGLAFIDCIADGHPSQVPLRWNELSEELNLVLEPVWQGKTTALQAIKKASPKLARLLQ